MDWLDKQGNKHDPGKTDSVGKDPDRVLAVPTVI